MGVGSITGAKEVTQGVVHAAQGGAGEAAHRIAAIGAHAGREAQAIGAHGQREAMVNGEETLKTMRDFAVKTLWEKPIAEAEEKLRELDLECRSKGWRDENGVERPGFDLVRGAEAAQIGEQWDAYMARKSKEIFDGMGLTAGQREELAKRTARFRAETKARLTERGAVELVTSNLADIDRRAVRLGEIEIRNAVENPDTYSAEKISDNLVEKRSKLIRDKVIGGLGRKSEDVATAEADKIVRAEAIETVKALAAAGHYDRARKLVEQGKKLGYDDAALAKGRAIVDKYEEKAQKDAFNGVHATAQSAIAMGRLNGEVDPKTGAALPGMEDALAAIRGAKEKFAVGTEMRANYDKLEAQVDRQADRQAEFGMWSEFPEILGKDYGKRSDGMAKGRGFLGELKLPDGRIATEYSIGVEIDGKETEIPTLVPTLTEAERKKMVEDIIPNGKKVPKAIEEKAVKHAKERMKAGRSPFADAVDSNPYPNGTRQHRLYPALAQEFERQMGAIIDAETKARQADRSGRMKEEMVAAVRSNAPGAFMAKLAEESKNGGISVAQFNEIADDARKLYANTAAAERARTMLDIYQRTFFDDPDLGVKLEDIYKYDKGEGRVVAKPPKDFDLSKLDVEYETEDGDKAFTSQQQLWLMNLLLKLSFHEGEVVLWDVESGAKSAEPKKVSPMQYFSDVCRKIKFSNEVQSPDVQRTIDSLAEVGLGIETDIAARNRDAVQAAPKPAGARKALRMPRLSEEFRVKSEE